MLNVIREHADSWLIKSILWLIVFAFVGTIFYSWGMGGASSSSGGVMATVNGAKISQGEYERTFNNLINFYREQLQGQFSEGLIEKLDLKNVSPKLFNAKNLQVHVPGVSQPNPPTIFEFGRTIEILKSKQRPKVISLTGSDGKSYQYLLKSKENLKQDERAMQLFSLINTLFGFLT